MSIANMDGKIEMFCALNFALVFYVYLPFFKFFFSFVPFASAIQLVPCHVFVNNFVLEIQNHFLNKKVTKA